MSVTADSASAQRNAAGGGAGNAARIALRGDLLDFTGTPDWGEVDSPAVRLRPDHWLLIEGGRIQGAQPDAPDDGWQRHDHRGRLILPGFIDTHVHMPQLDMIASYGTELLDWLNTYTFSGRDAVCATRAVPAGLAAVLRRAACQRHHLGGGVRDRAQGVRARTVRGRPGRAACG